MTTVDPPLSGAEKKVISVPNLIQETEKRDKLKLLATS